MLNNLFRFVKLKSLIIGKELSITCGGHENEEIHQKPMLEQYGFASVPPVGSEGLSFFPNGYTENAVVGFLDSPEHKPVLTDGESCLYDKFGNSVSLKDGLITITAVQNLTINVTGDCNLQANSVTVTSPITTINGNLSVNGNISASGTCDFGGGSGDGIARVGDAVLVNGQAGVITSGSSNSRTN